MRTVVHLTASTFLGGPERQMLGLAAHLPAEEGMTAVLSFSQGGRSRAFGGAAGGVGGAGGTPRGDAAAGRRGGHAAESHAALPGGLARDRGPPGAAAGGRAAVPRLQGEPA